jgi:hypothetical protein
MNSILDEIFALLLLGVNDWLDGFSIAFAYTTAKDADWLRSICRELFLTLLWQMI